MVDKHENPADGEAEFQKAPKPWLDDVEMVDHRLSADPSDRRGPPDLTGIKLSA